MNEYHIGAIILGVLLVLLLIYLFVRYIFCSFSGYPNCPCPPVCPKINVPQCPSCPACPAPLPPPIPVSDKPVTPPTIDSAGATTDLNVCNGTWKLKPTDQSGYMTLNKTRCLIPGSDLTINIPDSSSCLNPPTYWSILFTGAIDPANPNYPLSAKTSMEFSTDSTTQDVGAGMWPPNRISVIPGLSSLYFKTGANEVRYHINSLTDYDVYINGVNVGKFTKDPWQIEHFGLESNCLPDTCYAKITSPLP
jgi:hypothetical protein